MASLGLYLLLIFSSQYITNIRGSFVVTDSNPSATNFIRTSCNATFYPLLCFQLLSVYAGKIQQNEHELARAALSVSLAKAQSTILFVSRMPKVPGIKPREFRAVKDCIVNMQNTVSQLRHSMKEFDLMGEVRVQDFVWHMSNVQTWVSAALTFEDTCVDGFSGPVLDGRVKASVKGTGKSVSGATPSYYYSHQYALEFGLRVVVAQTRLEVLISIFSNLS